MPRYDPRRYSALITLSMLSFAHFLPLPFRTSTPFTPRLRPHAVSCIPRYQVRTQLRACASATEPAEPVVRYQDDGTRVVPIDIFVQGTSDHTVSGVYAVLDEDRDITFVGMSRDVSRSLTLHVDSHDEELVDMVKVMTFEMPKAAEMSLVVETWLKEGADLPIGNQEKWAEADGEMEAVLRGIEKKVENEATGSIVSPFETTKLDATEEAEPLELTIENVDEALNEVRPYLMSDGGNISVISVNAEEKKVTLQLEGACGSCSSASMTMEMGVEKALQGKFGNNLEEVVAISAPQETDSDVTPEKCNEVLDEVRPALEGLGATAVVVEVDEDEAIVEFSGANNLRHGVELLLKERVPSITTVTFEEPAQ
eukprot:GFKZ01009237.1.p1 GENE.GFKZ01009237.1~~GFKZ01009237.1.p1  ORF type:complete len:369 (+),score=58.77 GFKZ01009237.1:688-1794(+)